jgi:hypothetical protein
MDVPWGVHNDAQNLRLESFQNFNVGGGGSAPELYTVGPDGFYRVEVCCWWRVGTFVRAANVLL